MNWETTAKMIELKNIFFNLKKYFCLWGALSGNLRRESKWDSCYVWDSFHLPTASLGHSTHRFQSSLPLQAVCWGWFCGWRTWAQRDARVPTASQLDGQGQDCNLGALETSVSPYRGTRLCRHHWMLCTWLRHGILSVRECKFHGGRDFCLSWSLMWPQGLEQPLAILVA